MDVQCVCVCTKAKLIGCAAVKRRKKSIFWQEAWLRKLTVWTSAASLCLILTSLLAWKGYLGQRFNMEMSLACANEVNAPFSGVTLLTNKDTKINLVTFRAEHPLCVAKSLVSYGTLMFKDPCLNSLLWCLVSNATISLNITIC